MDQHKDEYWTEQEIQRAIEMPLYELWKAGKQHEAAGLSRCFSFS
jgi:hypothetical protein